VSWQQVEQEAIQAARSYAATNGYDDQAAGIVLAGMVIASMASVEAQQQLVHGYAQSFPHVGRVLRKWADRLNQAAEAAG
jgi:DNA-binding transcriptional regulator YbjK